MMAEGKGGEPPPDLQAMARDWITIWQSEWCSMATDRELQDTWIRMVTLWAETAERASRLLPPGRDDGATRRAGAPAPARSAAPVAAPDDRDAAIQRLEQRIAELERRLAAGNGGMSGA